MQLPTATGEADLPHRQFRALTRVIVNTTVWMPAPSDETRGVRSDATQLAELAARVDQGEPTIDIAERVPITNLASIHTRAAEGTLNGKVVILPTSA